MRKGGGGGGGGAGGWWWQGVALCLLILVVGAKGETTSQSMEVLRQIFSDITNPEKAGWPVTDPCGTKWPHVSCSPSGDVTSLYIKDLNLTGTLSKSITTLPSFTQLHAQNNLLTGPLPSFAGVSTLTTVYLSNNAFTSIPGDFFDGLSSLQILSIDNNPGLNGTTGWSIPAGLASSAPSLTTLTMSRCNIRGAIPDFLGNFSQLQVLNLAGNALTGGIPDTFSRLSGLVELKLNGQSLSGSTSVVGSMSALTTLWLHQNAFTGTIPETLSSAIGMADLELNDNKLVGMIPDSFSGLSALRIFNVQNNDLVGDIPLSLLSATLNLAGNNFCSLTPGETCTTEVAALLEFLDGVNYPAGLSNWGGADACNSTARWSGVSCLNDKVVTINLPSASLTGTISPFLANLTGLTRLVLSRNNLSGPIPPELAKLPNIALVDLEYNNLSGPLPVFPPGVLNITGNPLLDPSTPSAPGSSPPSPVGTPPSPGSPPSVPTSPRPSPGNNNGTAAGSTKSSSVSVGLIVGCVVGAVVLLLLLSLCAYFLYKRKRVGAWRVQSPNNLVEPTRDSDEVLKVVVGNGSPTNVDGRGHSGPSGMQVEGTNIFISIQVLREVTDNFSDRNILGRGGFGVVYKGELGDGTKIAVKRMEAAAVSNKGMDEFQAEIQVLTKVRHRHLVALLGYCVDGGEKLLVYEYMPQGTLSQHLFEYARYECKPLTWKQRLVIALDVARGIEYLHGLAHKSFIHRDLKPSNILLGDDLRAKVSDFGLVKLAPDGKYSVETRLAGTFGYLAPEYAGKFPVSWSFFGSSYVAC